MSFDEVHAYDISVGEFLMQTMTWFSKFLADADSYADECPPVRNMRIGDGEDEFTDSESRTPLARSAARGAKIQAWSAMDVQGAGLGMRMSAHMESPCCTGLAVHGHQVEHL